MQNAECRMQNDFAPQKLRKQGKIILVRNAECGVQNDFTTLRFAHKENYIFIRMSVVQRSEDNSAFCVLHSALKIKTR